MAVVGCEPKEVSLDDATSSEDAVLYMHLSNCCALWSQSDLIGHNRRQESSDPIYS